MDNDKIKRINLFKDLGPVKGPDMSKRGRSNPEVFIPPGTLAKYREDMKKKEKDTKGYLTKK